MAEPHNVSVCKYVTVYLYLACVLSIVQRQFACCYIKLLLTYVAYQCERTNVVNTASSMQATALVQL